jgi:cytochrome c biogenesis factor
MKDKFKKIFSSFVTTILLLLVYALGLAVATFIEKYQGTAVAKAVVYYSPLFFILQLLLVINFIVVIVKHKYFTRGKLGLVLTHFALIFILLGALTTHLLGKEGIFSGQSAVIQMPTSAGKTKSTEIIIRSAFMSQRTKIAVVVAPFKALCHEIERDYYFALFVYVWCFPA